MAAENDPAKLLLPYLQRADELQKHEHLVAYYCRLYAMERGLKIPQGERTKTTNSLLISLMNQLEKDKKSLKLGPEDNLYLEGFALNVFGKADKQDRAGQADINTAKTFYAASIFFEILNQFGVLPPDLEQKQKYAAWKAADIRKALKEGRQPNPGPPAGDKDYTLPSSQPSNSYDLGSSETTNSSPGPGSDPSLHYNGTANYHQSLNTPPPSRFNDTVIDRRPTYIPPSQEFHDAVNNQHSSNVTSSAPSNLSSGYPSEDYQPPPAASRSESPYCQQYNHHIYPREDQQPMAPNYSSHETAYSYPHFQSYPSFMESSLPSVSSNHHSYIQGSEGSYSFQAAPPTTNYSPSSQVDSCSRNGSTTEPFPTSHAYQYDSNYQPSSEKIAEAQKAARFAVGALAFDDVSIAVDYLRKSLELLTNPSSG